MDVVLVAELHRRVHAALDGSASSHALPATSSGATVNSTCKPNNASTVSAESEQPLPDTVPAVRTRACGSSYLCTRPLACARNSTPNTSIPALKMRQGHPDPTDMHALAYAPTHLLSC